VSPFLYSRYAADSRELCEILWFKSYKMFFINVQIWQLLSLVLWHYECILLTYNSISVNWNWWFKFFYNLLYYYDYRRTLRYIFNVNL